MAKFAPYRKVGYKMITSEQAGLIVMGGIAKLCIGSVTESV